MAYISEDPKPARRLPAEDRVGVKEAGGDEGALCVSKEIIPPTRRGDDAPRPARPSSEELKRVLEERERERKIIISEEVSRKTDEKATDTLEDAPAVTEAKGRSVKNLIVYSCVLLLGLWICNVFYSVLKNVLVAQTRGELVLALALLVATVGVFAFIVIYAWSLFSGLPRIDSIKESDFVANTYKLMERIRGDYVSRLPQHGEFAKRLRLSATGDLALSLKGLQSDEYADSKSFLVDFKEFQSLQDKQAAAVIKKYVLLIAVKTAASPWRIVDMVAVFFNSTLMICEIASVYNRRVSRAQALRLLINWMLNLYVSGELGRVMDGAADVLNDNLGDVLGSDGLGALIQPFLPLFSKFVGKAAEGGVNAYLAYRLGRRSVLAFRYLKR